MPELYDMPERYSRISPLADPAGRETASELERLRVVEQRVREAHTKAVDAVRQLESWRTVKDEHVRTVLYAKWGSAMFYRDKLAQILGQDR